MDPSNFNYAQARELLNNLENDLAKLEAAGKTDPALVDKISQAADKLQEFMGQLHKSSPTMKQPDATPYVQTPYIPENEITAKIPEEETFSAQKLSELDQTTIETNPPTPATPLYIYVRPLYKNKGLCFRSLLKAHPKAFADCDDYHLQFVPNPTDAFITLVPVNADKILELKPDQLKQHIKEISTQMPPSINQNLILTFVGKNSQINKLKELVKELFDPKFPSGFMLKNSFVPFIAFYKTDLTKDCDLFDCNTSRELYEKTREIK